MSRSGWERQASCLKPLTATKLVAALEATVAGTFSQPMPSPDESPSSIARC
jgi:hypothetical protein